LNKNVDAGYAERIGVLSDLACSASRTLNPEIESESRTVRNVCVTVSGGAANDLELAPHALCVAKSLSGPNSLRCAYEIAPDDANDSNRGGWPATIRPEYIQKHVYAGTEHLD